MCFGMAALDTFIDDRLAAGRGWFSRDEAVASGIALSTLSPALTRAVAEGKLTRPRHGFYLIVRPEHRAAGAADPAEWIDPLMKHQGLGYRVSLLRAATHHGASHRAAMIFQVVAPRQLRDLTLARTACSSSTKSPRPLPRATKPRSSMSSRRQPASPSWRASS
jgi:hypothetical protein